MTKTYAALKAGSAALAVGVALTSVSSFAQTADDADTADAIIVTGSRIARPELTAASPVSVVSSQDIKLQGASRVEDVLNSLPSVFASQASSLSNGADGTASIDLRGLGTSRTLSLVNGRRLLPGDPSPTSGSAADVNMIPAAMLKRVEVLTGGASSVYGADAVSGVVNFIIDTDFEGFRIDGNFNFYQHNNRDKFLTPLLDARANAGLAGYDYPKGSVSDGHTIDATAAFGTKFGDDRGHAMVYFGYRKVNPVIQRNRDYSACVLQNSGTGVPRCGGSATSDNGNVFLFDTSVNPDSSTAYTFAPNGGFDNSTSLYNFAPTNYFQRPDKRYTAGLFANYEISDAVKPYVEFMFMDDKTVAQIAPSGDFGNTLTVNCDNPLMSAAQRAVVCDSDNLINGFLGTFPLATAAPYNPNPGNPPRTFFDSRGVQYQQGFFQLLRRNVEGGPRQAELTHTNYRAVLGSKGQLGEAWSYDAFYQYGRSNYTQIYRNEFSVAKLNRALNVVTDTRPGATFGQPVCRAVIDGSDPSCVPYNVFGGAGGASAASVAYLSATGFQSGSTTEQVANVSFTGDLSSYGLKTPWADDGVIVNFGVEWRRESLDLQTDQAFSSGDLTGQGGATLPLAGNFKVLEFFGEASIPLVQDGFVKDLTLNAGYRRSDYKTSAGRKYGTDTFKVGLDFAPIPDIRFRAMFNRAVRAPNIQELFATPTVGLNGSDDPCSGHTIAANEYGCIAQGLIVGSGTASNPAGQYNGLIGGNLDLKPERATTKTFGVVLQPSFLPRFALTVDYFDIKIRDAIRQYGQDAILQDCVTNATASFTPLSCGLVRRDAASSIWLTPGGFVVDTPNNVGSVQTKGIEINGSYSYPVGFGNVSLNFNGTYLDEYKVDNGITSPYNCAGYYGPTCSVGGTTDSGAPLPKWRHKARLSLTTDSKIGVSLQWRYIGKVTSETLSSNPTLTSADRFDPGLKIGSQSYFDLSASYVLKDDFTFRLGVNNLFDKQPPYVTSGNGGVSGTNLCPTGPCNGNTYPATYDALGRYLFLSATLDF
jgi:outer membrane receptor protein involved in Fe transport